MIRRAAKNAKIRIICIKSRLLWQMGEEKVTYRYGKPKYYATEEILIIDTNLLNVDCVLVN